MSHLSRHKELYHRQQAISAKCFHPSGSFVEFTKEEVEQSIPDRFEKIVCKYSDRIAVKTANHVLTYGELNATANRVVGAILSQQGSDAEPVGLLFEKDAPLIAAMIGVLKAGKFFVLLDPSLPKARIATMLEDSQAQLVLTNQRNISLAQETAGSRLRLMEFESIDSAVSAEDMRLPVSPKALAFVIYTSGSTGQPKGVVQNHRNILHHLMLRTNVDHLCENDTIALLPSGTSNTITTAFQALLNGAALLPFDVRQEGVTRLASWLLEERISICLIASPLFRKLCEALKGEENFPDLRLLRLRSEAVFKGDVDLYKEFFPRTCILANGLSCSETLMLRIYLMDHETEITGDEVPVGYAVEDKEILVLDDTGRQLGFNEVGEIAVRSSYLSPGYWRRPELTTAKFVPDPKGGEERIYLTGDLGLMFPDGCLIHKGRKDFRVKIRGYGVEFGEVEKALLKHPAIREAVVVARRDELDQARLVAYYTSSNQPSPSVSELQGFLKRELSDYMIPSAFVMLDSIPITSAGKIDRQALPDPDKSRPDLDTRYVAPRSQVEKELAHMWTEILGKEYVGMQDNFFDLGGDSLLATKILTRVRDLFDVDLPLATLFDKPTIADLAERIAQIAAIRVGCS